MGSKILFLSNSILRRCSKGIGFDSYSSPALRPKRRRSHELHPLPHSVVWTKAGDSRQIRITPIMPSGLKASSNFGSV